MRFHRASRTTLVHGVDQRVVALGDGTATQLAGVRQHTVVGGEFLVQDREAVDLRFCQPRIQREVCVHLGDTVGDQFIHLVARGKSAWPVYEMLFLSAHRPTAAMSMSMSAQTLSRPLPKTTASLM